MSIVHKVNFSWISKGRKVVSKSDKLSNEKYLFILYLSFSWPSKSRAVWRVSDMATLATHHQVIWYDFDYDFIQIISILLNLSPIRYYSL